MPPHMPDEDKNFGGSLVLESDYVTLQRSIWNYLVPEHCGVEEFVRSELISTSKLLYCS